MCALCVLTVSIHARVWEVSQKGRSFAERAPVPSSLCCTCLSPHLAKHVPFIQLGQVLVCGVLLVHDNPTAQGNMLSWLPCWRFVWTDWLVARTYMSYVLGFCGCVCSSWSLHTSRKISSFPKQAAVSQVTHLVCVVEPPGQPPCTCCWCSFQQRLPAAVSALVACCCLAVLVVEPGQHAFLAQLLGVCVGSTRPTTLLHAAAAAAAAVSSKACCCCWSPALVACCSLGVFVGRSGQHAFLAQQFACWLEPPGAPPSYTRPLLWLLQLSAKLACCCFSTC